ncbi:MAG: FkbM family methyltransferase [Bacteroidota bacterium]
MREVLKKTYRLLPFKKQLFSVIKKTGTPPQRIYKHLHFRGKFRVTVKPGKSFQVMHNGFEIENELFWKGLQQGWEKISIGLWVQLCERSQVIFDIGANTGIYSLVAKTINPAARVFAFEPVERVFSKLKANCELNNYDIVCCCKAVSDYTGKAVIYDTTDEHVLSVTVNKNLHSPLREVRKCEIETITLKPFVEENRLEGADLMKIDVETHEPEVLEGFEEYLKKFRPTLLIEILTDEVGAKVSKLTEGLDYLYFNIDENKGIRQVSTIEHSDYYNFLMCSREIARQLKLIST